MKPLFPPENVFMKMDEKQHLKAEGRKMRTWYANFSGFVNFSLCNPSYCTEYFHSLFIVLHFRNLNTVRCDTILSFDRRV